jgi:hypothetical protein
VQNKLPVADTESEYTKGCQDPFSSQDPYDRAIKLLAAVCDGELEHNDSMDSRLKEDTNIISAPQNDSSHMTHTPAATAPQESVTAIDGQSATLARSALMISESNDTGRPQHVAEVADSKQE